MRLGFPDHINAIRYVTVPIHPRPQSIPSADDHPHISCAETPCPSALCALQLPADRSAAPPGYILPALASLNRTMSLRQTLQYQNAAYILLHHLVNTLLPLNNADEDSERNGTETDEEGDTAAPPKTLDQLVRTRLFAPLKMTQTYYNHLDALQSGKMADNWLSVGDDPEKCSRDWREKSDGACNGPSEAAGPPKSCMGEMMPAGWFLDEGDDGLHLAGWAGVVSCSEDVVRQVLVLSSSTALSSSFDLSTPSAAIPLH